MASGAEVATAGASEGAEEATGEDTDLERWTQGQIHSNVSHKSATIGQHAQVYQSKTVSKQYDVHL